MGFSFGNAIAGVKDPYIRACFMRLLREINATGGSLSTITRNGEVETGSGPGSVTTGTGTATHLTKWAGTPGTLEDSIVTDVGGLVGVNATPDARLTIGGGSLPAASSVTAWYRSDTINASDTVLGVLSTGALLTSWRDSSGNGHDLVAHGCTLADVDTPAFRPRWYPALDNKAITLLPGVSFEGSTVGTGAASYFTITGGPLTFPEASGFTIAMIWRDHSDAIPNGSTLFGSDVPLGGDVDDNIRMVNGVNVTNWIIQQGGGDKSFSSLYSHTDGNDTDIVILRVTSGTGVASNTLRCWVDGIARNQVVGDVRGDDPLPYAMRYIGRHLVAAGNVSTTYGKSLVELIIYNRDLNDTEVAAVNVYLSSRIAGTELDATVDLTRWESSTGTVLTKVDTDGNVVCSGGTSIYLDRTTAATTGVIFKDISAPYRWMHDYTDPSDDDFPNLFIGKNAGNFTINGDGTPSYEGTGNIGIGELALNSLTKGYSNFAAGYHALGSTTTGFFNFGLGEESLGANLSGSNNVGVGQFTLLSNTTGGLNVAIGGGAGQTNVSGSQNVYIGSGADATGGAFSNQIGIGYNVTVDASNKIVLGNTSTTVTELRSNLSIWNLADTFKATMDLSSITADRTYTFPNASGTLALVGGGLSGSGTTDVVAKFTSASTLGDSLFSDDGSFPALHSTGAAKLILDTSLLEAVSAGDKTFYLWEQDPTIGVGLPTFVSGSSPTPGTLAQWSLDANYPTTIQDSGGLTFDGDTFDITNMLASGSLVMRVGLPGTFGLQFIALCSGGVSTIECVGAGGRLEITGSTTAEVLAVNGKAITRGNHTVEGDCKLTVAGKTITISEAANGKMGIATLVAGVAVVNTTAVTANSRIQLTRQTVAGTPGTCVDVTARTPGTSFTITANGSILDTSTVAWVIFEPS